MFVIFSLSGMIGFGVSFLGGVHTTLGASAGLCGLIGALWYFGRSRGGEWGLAVYRQTSGWLISLGLFGMFIPNIDNWGHAGGFLGGIVLGWLLQYSKNRKESLVDHTLAAVMGVATLFFLGRSVIQALILISP
jgi:rhomboid protease GluP